MAWCKVALAALKILPFTLLVAAGESAVLKPETVSAWQDYIKQEDLSVHKRTADGQSFFWADQNPTRFEKLRAGSMIVEPMGEPNPLHVPSGLIHHWIGAVFIPNSTAEDLLSVTRDYGHYKDYYKPGVADAKPISTSPDRDEFTIRFVNSSVLSKTSLEGTYSTDFVRLNDKRWYTVSLTTQMQEIRDFGQAKEKRFAPNQGSGYIWRLYSTARLEERDGGVLLEIEAIALSREIPAALHWFVDPIVRRISRESLEKSLAETVDAVRNHAQACAEQAAHSSSGVSQTIVVGTCAHTPDSQHASDSNFRN